MAAPETWASPASGGTVSADITQGVLSYANGYYFAHTRTAAPATALRYTTDPTGTWSTATLPTPPTGYNSNYSFNLENGVVSDGTTFAFRAIYSGATPTKHCVVYATDPGGTWSVHELDPSSLYYFNDIAYGDGKWALVGYVRSTIDPLIAYSTAVAGTYTFNTSYATTGYDTSGGLQWSVTNINYDGSTWVTSASDFSGGTAQMRHSTSLTSSWGTPTSSAITGTQNLRRLRYNANNYWSAIAYSGTGSRLIYTDNPSGTWSYVTDTTIGATRDLYDAYPGGGYWLAGGDITVSATPDPYLAYTPSAGAPSGSWTAVASDGATRPNDYFFSMVHAGNYFVTLARIKGELNYTSTASAPAPRRAIGTSFHLRQRQTPYIT